MKNLIIYYSAVTSGNRAGWGFIKLKGENSAEYEAGYGSADAKTDAEARIVGCLTALLHSDIGKVPDKIQLRSDILNTNDLSQRSLDGHYKLPEPIMVSLEKIQFKEVDLNDGYLKKVRMYAKTALESINPEDGQFCYKDSKRKEFNKFLLQQNSCNTEVYDGKSSSQLIPWYCRSGKDVIHLPTQNIVLNEEVHFKAKKVVFEGGLNGSKAITPIAVRPLAHGKYALIVGLSVLCTAKLLHISHIPVVVYDIEREEFIRKFILSKRTI